MNTIRRFLNLSRPLRLLALVPVVFLLTAPIFLAAPAPAEAAGPLFKAGSYAGTGVAQGITGVGFQPDVVILKSETTNALMRTSQMSTNDYKNLSTGSFANSAARIRTLDADGFTVGTNADVNTSGTTYYYMAWKAVLGSMAVGSYTGDGGASQSVTSVGFTPVYAIVSPRVNAAPFQRSSSMSASWDFGTGTSATAITALSSSSSGTITVGSTLNGSAVVYDWTAWGAVDNKVATGYYNGSAGNAGYVGFPVSYVTVKAEHTGGSLVAVQSSSALPASKHTMYFSTTANNDLAITGVSYTSWGLTAGSTTNPANDTSSGNANYYTAFSRYFDSYSNSDYAVGHISDSFSGLNTVVYLRGIFTPDIVTGYKVTFYDGTGTLVTTNAGKTTDSAGVFTDSLTLTSDYRSFSTGNWHAVVQPSGQGVPASYGGINMTTDKIEVIDAFQTSTAELPEIPTFYAAMAAILPCLGLFYWMRKKALPAR